MMGVNVFYIWHTPCRVSPFFRLQRKIEFRLKLEGGGKKSGRPEAGSWVQWYKVTAASG